MNTDIDTKKICIIVQARLSSTRIPKKMIKPFSNTTLLDITLNRLTQSTLIPKNDIYISLYENKLKEIAKKYDVTIFDRSQESAETNNDMVKMFEWWNKLPYEYYIIVSACHPFLSIKTIDAFYKKFQSTSSRGLFGVVKRKNYFWNNKLEFITPWPENQTTFNTKVVEETYEAAHCLYGGKMKDIGNYIYMGDFSKKNDIELFTIHDEFECSDIDYPWQFDICESYYDKYMVIKHIVINVIGNNKQGTGHIYRMLRLTNACTSSRNYIKKYDKLTYTFIIESNQFLAEKILINNNVSYKKYDSKKQMYQILDAIKPDIIINDCLNTDMVDINSLQKYTKKIINFEDYGSGARSADFVINSFYNSHVICGNQVKYGLEYTLLSPLLSSYSFNTLCHTPKKLLLTFGGSDPTNITKFILDMLIKHKIYERLDILVILGLGYTRVDEIKSLTNTYENISISVDEQDMIGKMKDTDLAISSCGSAMFELAYFTVPTISIAHHEREMLHTKLCENNSIIHLGIKNNVNEKDVIQNLEQLINNVQLRIDMKKNMEKMHHIIKHSYKNVFDLIFN
tara:strand:- start:8470 stop:10176 length:1707 start_codon:yes stop_codon:yes gene_type:complete